MKKIIAILIALGLAGGGTAMAQNVNPTAPLQAPKVLTLPLQVGCFPLSQAEEFMSHSNYRPMFRGKVVLVRPEGSVAETNDGTNSTLWYSREENSIVSFLWNRGRNLACITHMIKDVTIDEEAWKTVGRPASVQDDD